ncbi:MAG: acetyl-coenzyme A synthetase N-terminal domain-containing protein, partial [Bacteroidota bacterium]
MTKKITSFEDYQETYNRSVSDPEGFWHEQASSFQWKKPYKEVVKWNFRQPKVKWFAGGKLNITENVLDRHLATRGKQTAILWEPNDPNDKTRIVTYNRLHKSVCQVAQMLTNLGVKKGDRVCI